MVKSHNDTREWSKWYKKTKCGIAKMKRKALMVFKLDYEYKKTAKNDEEGVAIMKTIFLMVFKLDDEGNAVYTQDMGDLTMFLSMSEPFCVPSASFPGLAPNYIRIFDIDEIRCVNVASPPSIPSSIACINDSYSTPYYFPPQDY
ncbi:unnamed protein product [Eruca vesicaria subsp. sativa]|uniref:DUF295 domain-containing protein n=1 Tax=Eruca vesicaria subsp. sativa TaxID=29727 RepID=A0ABC8K8X8_ERUVS|nr:unnamed protein product [Eruca vesicaria subsp. sativa]